MWTSFVTAHGTVDMMWRCVDMMEIFCGNIALKTFFNNRNFRIELSLVYKQNVSLECRK